MATTNTTSAGSSSAPDLDFCQRLPKVELHAHLTGSITRDVLQMIWEERRAAEPDLALEPPATALADPSGAQGIDAFFSHFNTYIYHLINTPHALTRATRAVLQMFADDGVTYLELRTTPRPLAGTGGAPGSPTGATTAEETIRAVLSELGAWNASPSGDRMRVHLILSVDRAKHDAAAANATVDLALKLKGEGHPVVGLDVCGDPNAPAANGAAEGIAALRPPFQRAHKAGLPCVLHFAEVPASSREDELEELLSWHPVRLGHAIHVPGAMRYRILAEGIAPELCLSCNVLAGMLPASDQCAAGFVDHHFGWWWASGGALSLGTDDVGVFGASSSEEHLHAATHFRLGRAELVELGRRAVRNALGGEQDKQAVGKALDAFAKAEGLVSSA